MIERLRLFLGGKLERSALVAWAHTVWPPSEETQGGPFPCHPTASTVFDSIWNAEARIDSRFVVAEHDIETYLQWLTRGDVFRREAADLAIVLLSKAEVSKRTGCAEVHYWVEGLGCVWEIRFASPATGRPFVIGARLGSDERLGVSTAQGDDWSLALGDLFETLAIDDADVVQVSDRVDVASLPRWRLTSGEADDLEILGEYGSYAKLLLARRTAETQGHSNVSSEALSEETRRE